MNNDKIPVICRSCQRTVTMDKVKYDDVQRFYVCFDCFKKTHPSNIVINEKKKPQGSFDVAPTSNKKINYQCPNCKFAFSRVPEKKPSSCPYCANKVLDIRDQGASKLINESEGWN